MGSLRGKLKDNILARASSGSLFFPLWLLNVRHLSFSKVISFEAVNSLIHLPSVDTHVMCWSISNFLSITLFLHLSMLLFQVWSLNSHLFCELLQHVWLFISVVMSICHPSFTFKLLIHPKYHVPVPRDLILIYNPYFFYQECWGTSLNYVSSYLCCNSRTHLPFCFNLSPIILSTYTVRSFNLRYVLRFLTAAALKQAFTLQLWNLQLQPEEVL